VLCPHGVCYACWIMPQAEGRNEMYSFMVSYLKRAPDVVIYDFACSLQEYCLNRAPAFFRETRFVVDRFHWCNHTACSAAYNMSLYADITHVNSELAEQVNSALQYIRPNIAAMTTRSAVMVLRFFLHVRNTQKLEKLRIAACVAPHHAGGGAA
jgi:hypothetical protein